MSFRILTIIICVCCAVRSAGQERVAAVDHNPLLKQSGAVKDGHKTTALALPFFEDFTDYEVYPNSSRWIDRTVYINNTMCFQPVSRGVATFDALNEKGGPYDSSSAFALVHADSLTSQQINLAGYADFDSIYFSFFYQPQGNGFSPETQDSLMLFFRGKDAVWRKMWSREGSSLQPFTQVMIPVTDTMFFHDEFQFRFMNKASINLNDDVWNVDYIRLNLNRSMFDTAINDIATTREPSFLLNDYSFMPYRQFQANQAGETAAQHWMYGRNNTPVAANVTAGYMARESVSNTPLFTSPASAASIAAYTEQQFSYPVYPISYNPPGPYSKVVFENTYYVSPAGGDASATNDTIVQEQVFDNYLAYDDGSAEKSYFLNLFATLPGKIAVEYHLNEPDTLRGVAIYFGRTVPLAFNKFFSIAVYNDIAVNGGTDQLIYQEDLFFPGYADTVNNFFVYKFDTPIPMPSGTFFLGTIQPASSGSDSLYLGLDVNRIGGNHLYFNVSNLWESSLVSGAVMMRPMLGQKIKSTGLPEIQTNRTTAWSVYPNPATDKVQIVLESESAAFGFELRDIQGRLLQKGSGKSGMQLDISGLTAGMYFVNVSVGGGPAKSQKIIKL